MTDASEDAERLRVTAAVNTAAEALTRVHLEGESEERRMLIAASFGGALRHSLPDYQVAADVVDAQTLQVTGVRTASSDGTVLRVTVHLPEHLWT